LRRCFLRAAAASSEEDLAFLWGLRLAGAQRDFFFLRLRRLAAVARATFIYSAGTAREMSETAR
jgi:hypothetical protein